MYTIKLHPATLLMLPWFSWTLACMLSVTGTIKYAFVLETIQKLCIGMVVACRIFTSAETDACYLASAEKSHTIGCLLDYPNYMLAFLVMLSYVVIFYTPEIDPDENDRANRTMHRTTKAIYIGVCKICILYYVFACVLILASRDLDVISVIAVNKAPTMIYFCAFVIIHVAMDCDEPPMTSGLYNVIKNSPDHDTDCVICQSLIDAEETTCVRTICGHFYHEECLDEWFSRSRTCPMCVCDLSKPKKQ